MSSNSMNTKPSEKGNEMNSLLILGTTSIFIVGAFVFYFMNKSKDEESEYNEEEIKSEEKEEKQISEKTRPKKKKKNKKQTKK